jgi:hypothetical protein
VKGGDFSAVIPKWQEVGREAVIVVGGALLAALIMSQFPSVKAWIKKAWE